MFTELKQDDNTKARIEAIEKAMLNMYHIVIMPISPGLVAWYGKDESGYVVAKRGTPAEMIKDRAALKEGKEI